MQRAFDLGTFHILPMEIAQSWNTSSDKYNTPYYIILASNCNMIEIGNEG
jgi:hypothetical protein